MVFKAAKKQAARSKTNYDFRPFRWEAILNFEHYCSILRQSSAKKRFIKIQRAFRPCLKNAEAPKRRLLPSRKKSLAAGHSANFQTGPSVIKRLLIFL